MNSITKFSVLLICSILVFSCKKEIKKPELTTNNVTEITTVSAISGGIITSDGGGQIVSKGVCWNTTQNPTIDNFRTMEGGESLTFEGSLTQLEPGTTYYVRSYAVNSAGTSYGNGVTFTTLGNVPLAVVENATNLSIDSAVLHGTVNPNSLSTTVTFEWGLINYEHSVSADQSQISGSSASNVSVTLTGLEPGSTYHYRIKSENSLGTTYSDDMIFTTLGQVPTIVTSGASGIQLESFIISGSVNPNYLPTSVICEWGTSTEYGDSVELTQNPITGSSDQVFSGTIDGLSEGVIYYFRIKATNDLGTTYGDQQILITNLTDFDGNIYHPIFIGTQVWLTENLKVTHYNDGTGIDYIDGNTPWGSISAGAYSYYNDDTIYLADYGNLYNWFAVSDPGGLCPTGWHVPSDSDWQTLTTYLGGWLVAGGKMKESGSEHWIGLNTGADNSSGFTALPGGRRFDAGDPVYGNMGSDGFWWSGTEIDSSVSWSVSIYTTGAILNIDNMYKKTWGFSVRCIKN